MADNALVNILWLYDHYTLKSCISRAMIQLWENEPHPVEYMHTSLILPFIEPLSCLFPLIIAHSIVLYV